MAIMQPKDTPLHLNNKALIAARSEFKEGDKLKIAPLNDTLRMISRMPRAASGYVIVDSVECIDVENEPDWIIVNIIIGEGEYVSVTYLELDVARKLERLT